MVFTTFKFRSATHSEMTEKSIKSVAIGLKHFWGNLFLKKSTARSRKIIFIHFYLQLSFWQHSLKIAETTP